MNREEKITLAHFLDLAGDCLGDGHARPRAEYHFEDDTPAEKPGSSFCSLPLAYQIDENPDAGPGEPEGALSASAGDSGEALENIAAEIRRCASCGLASSRKNAVPGEGCTHPLVMVIGEGPGADEDRAGRPFVGRAGQLLDKMLKAIGLFRDKNCYIANMVKCRPPDNRDPAPEEIAACSGFLEQQIALLRPKFILCLGRIAAQNILKTGKGVFALRGAFHEWKGGGETIPLLCTFHPSAILRNESLKPDAWEDLKLLRAAMAALDSAASPA